MCRSKLLALRKAVMSTMLQVIVLLVMSLSVCLGKSVLDSCQTGEFPCDQGLLCIPKARWCDGRYDCMDKTDEVKCPPYKKPPICSTEREFTCSNGRICIPKDQTCDGRVDCPDESDENDQLCVETTTTTTTTTLNTTTTNTSTTPTTANTTNTTASATTSNKSTKTTIPPTTTITTTTTESLPPSETLEACPSGSFRCREPPHCIPSSFRCDGEPDCPDSSDELCDKDASPQEETKECSEDQFPCPNDKKCIARSKVCDGNSDCNDNSDEKNCSSARPCTNEEFKCVLDDKCVSTTQVCDGRADCPDASDERNCGNGIYFGPVVSDCSKCPQQGQNRLCVDTKGVCCNREACMTLYCSFLCPGREDFCITKALDMCDPVCPDEDEILCGQRCPEGQFECTYASGTCVDSGALCNGIHDCPYGSDEHSHHCFEAGVGDMIATRLNWFQCDGGLIMVRRDLVCDGTRDCRDGSDEICGNLLMDIPAS